jgi:prepilin-type N-terminal cleavage/methylation domain-containing protein
MRRGKRKPLGFTLIELLIVVAIIGILAAIAIPNFLQAQVRAKVATAQTEMRTLGLALEQYYVDQNAYPYDWDSAGWPWYITDVITTPIEYVTGAAALAIPLDDIVCGRSDAGPGSRYRYFNLDANDMTPWPPAPMPGPYYSRWFPYSLSEGVAAGFRVRFGQWRLLSAGPDREVLNPFENTGFLFTTRRMERSRPGISFEARSMRSNRIARKEHPLGKEVAYR